MLNIKTVASLCIAVSLPAVPACGDPANFGNENEVITTVGLTFTPAGGGPPLTFEFNDPDGDGGKPPAIDPVAVAAGTYTVAVFFENRLEAPPEDITEEVADESDEHQIFFTGPAVDGPATSNPDAPVKHVYSDQDINTLPIGLTNTITATVGTGDLTVTLRHVPPINNEAVKTTDLASKVRDGGFSVIGGSTDAQVTFSVTVQ